MIPLPKWVLPPTHPVFYEWESKTALEGVATLYGAMNALIAEYNQFVDQTGIRLTEFESKVTAFVEKIRNEMVQNITGTATEVVKEGFKNGSITIPTDATLKRSNYPADAKAAGDMIEALREALAAERARIDNMAALPEGSTAGDAELIDIRSDLNGVVHTNAGTAVREQARYAKTIRDAALQPVYGETIIPSEIASGSYYNPDTGALFNNVNQQGVYGVAVFPVVKGKEYVISATYNPNGSYTIPVIGDNLAVTGTIENPVKLPEKARRFISPKNGYLYINYLGDVAAIGKFTITAIEGYKPVATVDTTANMVKVTAPYTTLANGLAATEDNTGIRLIDGDITLITDRLEPGVYDFPAHTYITPLVPLINDGYIPVIAEYEAAENVVINIECRYVCFTAPPIRHYPVNDNDQHTRAMLEEISTGTYKTGEEITGTETEWFGLINGAIGQIGEVTSNYNFITFPVAKGVEYLLSCESYGFPSSTYPLYAIGPMGGPIGRTSLRVAVSAIGAESGAFQHVVKPDFDGVLYVSHNTNDPSDIKLHTLTSATYKPKATTGSSQAKTYNKLLVIGDSLAGIENLWQPEFTELLGIPEYSVGGGSGLTITDQGADVNTIYNRIMALQPDTNVDLVILWGGYNDWVHGSEMGAFKASLTDCIIRIHTNYPTARVVLVGTTPYMTDATKNGRDAYTRANAAGNTLADYVEALKETARTFSAPVCNLLDNSGFHFYNFGTYFKDQGYYLHPNALGNSKIARMLAAFVKGLE